MPYRHNDRVFERHGIKYDGREIVALGELKIGDIIEHQGKRYRVTGFFRRIVHEAYAPRFGVYIETLISGVRRASVPYECVTRSKFQTVGRALTFTGEDSE